MNWIILTYTTGLGENQKSIAKNNELLKVNNHGKLLY